MTWRHLAGVAALQLENICLAVLARLADWRRQHAPETLEPPPQDLWTNIAARLEPPQSPEVIAFCCGESFTSLNDVFRHAATCRLTTTFSVPLIVHRDPRREARA